ncbi:MAG: type III pantothenate kinase [bacterium]
MSSPAGADTGWLLGDIGNSRVKLAWLEGGREAADRLFDPATRRFDARLTLPTGGLADKLPVLSDFLAGKRLGAIWLSSVHEEAAQQLVAMLDQVLESHDNEDIDGSVISSAADADLPGHLRNPEKTGADRALAVRAALRLHSGRGRGIVVLCGTAMTVEWVGSDGIWAGGAIAPGYRLGAMALDQGTAALPFVPQVSTAPLPFGTHTQTAMESGLFWGQVGTARELVHQMAGPACDHWEVWSGGDAHLLAPHAGGPQAERIDDLVLLGLADLALASQMSD